jgi:hypothetical protein
MSKLQYVPGLPKSDVNGYKLQRIILVVPISFDGIEDTVYQGKIVFWTGYNCSTKKYTTYSSGTVSDITLLSGTAEVPPGTYYYFGIPTENSNEDFESLFYYINNQDPDNPGYVVVDGTTPIPLNLSQNRSTIIYHYAGYNTSSELSWINKVWNASFGPMTFDVTFENKTCGRKQELILAYYPSDGDQIVSYVKFVSCANTVPKSLLVHNEIDLEEFYYQIYISFFDTEMRNKMKKSKNIKSKK